MTAASPVIAKVHAARPAGAPARGGADGDSRLPSRGLLKQAAQAEPSTAQATKEGLAKLRKDERQQQLLERRRKNEATAPREEAEEFALDAEDSCDLSDSDTPK